MLWMSPAGSWCSAWYIPSLFLSRSSVTVGSEVKDGQRGSESKRWVVLLDFLKEAISVTEGLVESSLRIRELQLQRLYLWWQDYWIGYVVWLDATRQVGGYRILMDSNRCNYNFTQPCILGHISELTSNRTPVLQLYLTPTEWITVDLSMSRTWAEVWISWPIKY